MIICQIGIISVILLLGNTIRRLTFFKKMLIPTAIIAGFIGLGLKYLINFISNSYFDFTLMPNEFYESITYHGIAIGFIAMGLKEEKKNGAFQGHPFKSGLLIVSTYLLQGVIGLTITIIIAFIFTGFPNYSGIILPLGFGQGPGQAGNIGGVYEQAGFIGGKSFGLMIAIMGTISASIGGIFYINKNKVERKNDTNNTYTEALVDSDKEISLSESIDKFTIQVSLVGFTYLLTFGFIYLVTRILPAGSISSLVWGFNFLIGMLFAILVKLVMKFLRKKNIMKHKYTNNYMLNRITGIVFDFMVICSIMAIEVEKLNSKEMWITLALLGVIGLFSTYFYVKFIVKKCFIGYEHEAFAVFYGNLTGTASDGIALLREIDPEFKTPASDDLVTGSSTAIMFGFPILLITGIINTSNLWTYLSYVLLIVLFFVFFYFLYFFKGVIGKKKGVIPLAGEEKKDE
jgi:ESS family glutamate:Na+ symporter